MFSYDKLNLLTIWEKHFMVWHQICIFGTDKLRIAPKATREKLMKWQLINYAFLQVIATTDKYSTFIFQHMFSKNEINAV